MVSLHRADAPTGWAPTRLRRGRLADLGQLGSQPIGARRAVVDTARPASPVDDERRGEREHSPVVGEIGSQQGVELEHLKLSIVFQRKFIQGGLLDRMAGCAPISAEEEDGRTARLEVYEAQVADRGTRQAHPDENLVGHNPRRDQDEGGEKALDHQIVPLAEGGRRPGRAPSGGDFENPGAPIRLSQ